MSLALFHWNLKAGKLQNEAVVGSRCSEGRWDLAGPVACDVEQERGYLYRLCHFH